MDFACKPLYTLVYDVAMLFNIASLYLYVVLVVASGGNSIKYYDSIGGSGVLYFDQMKYPNAFRVRFNAYRAYLSRQSSLTIGMEEMLNACIALDFLLIL